MEVEIGLGEREQEVLRRVIQMALSEREAHVATDEGIDLGSVQRLDRGKGFTDSGLERGESFRRWGGVRREDTLPDSLDGAEGVHCGGFHLICERLHIVSETGVNDIVSRDPSFG